MKYDQMMWGKAYNMISFRNGHLYETKHDLEECIPLRYNEHAKNVIYEGSSYNMLGIVMIVVESLIHKTKYERAKVRYNEKDKVYWKIKSLCKDFTCISAWNNTVSRHTVQYMIMSNVTARMIDEV